MIEIKYDVLIGKKKMVPEKSMSFSTHTEEYPKALTVSLTKSHIAKNVFNIHTFVYLAFTENMDS